MKTATIILTLLALFLIYEDDLEPVVMGYVADIVEAENGNN